MFQLSSIVVLLFGFSSTINAAPASESQVVKLVAYANVENSFGAQRLEDQKKVITLDISGKTISAIYGEKTPTEIKTALVLHSLYGSPETSFVFGKDCDGTKCRKSGVKSVYSEDGTKGEVWKDGPLQGNVWTDSITLGGAKFSASFGSVNQTTTYDENDGQFSLGIGAATNTKPTMLKALFGLGPEKFVTIYHDPKNSSAQMLIGKNGHDQCNTAKMYPISGEGHWWISDSKIMVDDQLAEKQTVEFSINEPFIKIPKTQFDALTKDQKPDEKNLVGDVTKLKSIKLTLGSDVYVLKPDDFTTKNKDNKYQLNVVPSDSTDNQPITLGIPFLQKNCLVLSGNDGDISKWQIGVGEHKNSAAILSASAVIIVALVQLLRF